MMVTAIMCTMPRMPNPTTTPQQDVCTYIYIYIFVIWTIKPSRAIIGLEVRSKVSTAWGARLLPPSWTPQPLRYNQALTCSPPIVGIINSISIYLPISPGFALAVPFQPKPVLPHTRQ